MAPPSQRSSMAPLSRARMSVAPGATANARLAAKQAELHALQNLRAESARLAHEITQLGDRVDTLVAGGTSTSATYTAVSSVMASWQGVFRAIQIAQGTSHTLTQPRPPPRARPSRRTRTLRPSTARASCRTRSCASRSRRRTRRSSYVERDGTPRVCAWLPGRSAGGGAVASRTRR